MHIITTTKELQSVCDRLATDTFVTVDTEFMRETTYWPLLCLIQIAGKTEEVIVDPLSEDLSLEPFMQLMTNTSVMKVFHAARQDVEIIHHLGGVVPEPMFDTQVAAMVCGFGDSIGYENIVRQLAGQSIDKSSRFTDWSRRPLSEKQLAYALSDVTHLRPVYQKLRESLNSSDRENWLTEEMAILTSPSTYAAEPTEAWKRLKFKARNKRAMAVFMSVAAWREREAQARDVPRNRVLKEDALGELAVQAPDSPEGLARLRALPRGFAQSKQAKNLLQAISDGRNMDPNTVPSVKHNNKQKVPAPASVVDLLKVTLKYVCESHGVASKLIANVADLEAIALDDQANVNALKGWRRKLYGEIALDVKHGKLAVALEDGEITIEPRRATRARAAE
ncbi:MAG: ribonuclease D [Alphaproteobacteria bacterium]|nr:ribonuclease D [Alphaproteobacteria bacterium]